MPENPLIFSATERCKCGKGLVFEQGSSKLNGYWQCVVVASNQQWTEEHTPRIYFRDQTILTEMDIAANGQTTRYLPQPTMSIYLDSGGLEQGKPTPPPENPPAPQPPPLSGMSSA